MSPFFSWRGEAGQVEAERQGHGGSAAHPGGGWQEVCGHRRRDVLLAEAYMQKRWVDGEKYRLYHSQWVPRWHFYGHGEEPIYLGSRHRIAAGSSPAA